MHGNTGPRAGNTGPLHGRRRNRRKNRWGKTLRRQMEVLVEMYHTYNPDMTRGKIRKILVTRGGEAGALSVEAFEQAVSRHN